MNQRCRPRGREAGVVDVVVAAVLAGWMMVYVWVHDLMRAAQ